MGRLKGKKGNVSEQHTGVESYETVAQQLIEKRAEYVHVYTSMLETDIKCVELARLNKELILLKQKAVKLYERERPVTYV